ncbi:hypothetical protein RHMOL_Rhmol11G0264100 [Rhododendron molle]|uniref:Uncharacterized protein n=1 Tax=Rhododendron molle TaxID=49168 RepID=A0ACC0LWL5_RHOML|nr:hypothetical protein RHMOL_Rhmol11G0264100 [Rhododendron molle]
MVCIAPCSDRASDGLDIISVMNGSRSLVAKMRSEPSNARSDCSEMRLKHNIFG